MINPRFVKPLDRTLIADAARRTGCVVTIEEHMLAGGFGSAVLELFEDIGLNRVQVARLGIPDVLVEQGTQAAMRARFSRSRVAIWASMLAERATASVGVGCPAWRGMAARSLSKSAKGLMLLMIGLGRCLVALRAPRRSSGASITGCVG